MRKSAKLSDGHFLTKLYDLTSICEGIDDDTEEKAAGGGGGGVGGSNNPFRVAVAMLLYRLD